VGTAVADRIVQSADSQIRISRLIAIDLPSVFAIKVRTKFISREDWQGLWRQFRGDRPELFYRSGEKMMAVGVGAKPDLIAGIFKMLFEGCYETSPFNMLFGIGYDVSPGGKRFLMFKRGGEQPASAQFHVVQDWFEELKRRVP